MMWWWLALAVLVSYFLWTVIHELSHLAVAKMLRHVTWFKIRPYPNRMGDTWFFASVTWKHDGDELTPAEIAAISSAPMILDIVGGFITMVVAAAVTGPALPLALVLAGGCLIDMFVNSLGLSEKSDLQKTARGWGVSPWWIRVAGGGFVLLTLASVLCYVLR